MCYVLSGVRVRQSGSIYRGDQHPFSRPQESRQARSLGSPEALGLPGLRLFALHHTRNRTGATCKRYSDKRSLKPRAACRRCYTSSSRLLLSTAAVTTLRVLPLRRERPTRAGRNRTTSPFIRWSWNRTPGREIALFLQANDERVSSGWWILRP